MISQPLEVSEVDLDRELVRRGGLIKFVELAWHVIEGEWAFVPGRHLDLVCAHLEAVSRGECTRLVINIPPGMSKSTIVSAMWPCWDWGPFGRGGRKWMNISFDQGVSLRDAEKARKLLTSDWFQERWGVGSPSDKPVTLMGQKKVVAKSMYFTNQGGMRMSTMVGGKGTGHHADIQCVDDPTKPETIRAGGDKAREALKRTADTWQQTFASRSRGKFARVVVMQRLHHNDLAATCIAEGYTHLCLPMEYVPEKHCSTPWGEDWRTEPGELLCPQREGKGDAVSVAKTKAEMGARVYAAQMQQDPTPDGGALFKREWLAKRWKYIPAGAEWWQSWDMTFKGLTDSDYVVGQVWAKYANEYYLVDQVRARMGFTATCRAVLDLTAKWPQAYLVLVEDKANGTAVMDTLTAQIPGLKAVEPKGGKEARANAVSPVFELGHVHLPEHAEWVGDLVEEFASFPLGANDDQVDAATQAISEKMPKERDRYGALAAALAPPAPVGMPVLVPVYRYTPENGDVQVVGGKADELAARFSLPVLAGPTPDILVVRAGARGEVVRYALQRQGGGARVIS
jgi:predicted phage terminase large subunit-like protein